MNSAHMAIYLAWATATGLIVARLAMGRPTAGLLVCFLVNQAMNHFFAQLCWDMTSVWLLEQAASSEGFLLTGNAMVGLTVGIVCGELIQRRQSRKAAVTRGLPPAALHAYARQALIFGSVVYLLGMTGVYAFIPSLGAVASTSAGVAIAGICLKFWLHYRAGRWALAYRWAAGILIYPVVTTLGGGFLGYGVGGVIAVTCFVLPNVRIKFGFVAIAPLVIYASISFWVTYAMARSEIRERVWGGQAYEARIDALYNGVVLNWQWFDVESQSHLMMLERLNQNILVGSSVWYMDKYAIGFGAGETLTNAMLSLVPRVIWANKPTYAGSGTLASRYTGREFAVGTSVGIGFLMELYVNFGTWGVTLGYVGFGLAVTLLDVTAGKALRSGQPLRFMYAFAAAQPLMNALGFSAEALPAIVGAVVCVWVFGRTMSARDIPGTPRPGRLA